MTCWRPCGLVDLSIQVFSHTLDPCGQYFKLQSGAGGRRPNLGGSRRGTARHYKPNQQPHPLSEGVSWIQTGSGYVFCVLELRVWCISHVCCWTRWKKLISVMLTDCLLALGWTGVTDCVPNLPLVTSPNPINMCERAHVWINLNGIKPEQKHPRLATLYKLCVV